MDIRFSTTTAAKTKAAAVKSGAIVLTVTDSLKLSAQAKAVDAQTDGAVSRALSLRDFKGKKGETLTLIAPAGVKVDAVIVLGLGKEKDSTDLSLQEAGGALVAHLNRTKIKEAQVIVEDAHTAAHLAYGAVLRNYRFDKYRTREKQEDKPTLAKVNFQVKENAKAEALFDALEKIAAGVYITRDFVSEPPNVLYPESYAQRIKDDLTKLGVKVEILGEEKMRQLGMGSLLGVGQGSIRDSQLVVMQWNGAKNKKEQPIAFVGKGVTFDTGGISIKPAAGMEDMKYDMGGSATVVGLIKALAGRKANVNAIGVVGLVENMPDGNAQRPSDIVHSMSGQTIEVLNTDAEGRLVLADALWYCQDRFKPQFMVDLATLTGAIVIALGEQFAGLFSNNDTLSERITAAGKKVGERVWRFPLDEAYDKMIDSPVADMQNISNGRGAGSITAAQFLQRFVNNVPWVHLDIAGMAWAKKEQSLCPSGATAYGVRLLNQLVEDHYEGGKAEKPAKAVKAAKPAAKATKAKAAPKKAAKPAKKKK